MIKMQEKLADVRSPHYMDQTLNIYKIINIYKQTQTFNILISKNITDLQTNRRSIRKIKHFSKNFKAL